MNSLRPNGYNICLGGNKPPVHHGEENCKAKLDQTTLQELYNDLAQYQLDFSQLAVKYGLHRSQIERINNGESWYNQNIDYPIRKMKKDQYIIGCIITDLKNNILTQEEIEKKYQIKSRTRLYNINNGKVGRKLFPQEKYPIRIGIKNQKPKYLENL